MSRRSRIRVVFAQCFLLNHKRTLEHRLCRVVLVLPRVSIKSLMIDARVKLRIVGVRRVGCISVRVLCSVSKTIVGVRIGVKSSVRVTVRNKSSSPFL